MRPRPNVNWISGMYETFVAEDHEGASYVDSEHACNAVHVVSLKSLCFAVAWQKKRGTFNAGLVWKFSIPAFSKAS